MLWDTHMHTHHSGDSDALMPDMIQAAVRQNLDGICFTDHFDYDYPDDPNLFLLDFGDPWACNHGTSDSSFLGKFYC